MIKVLVAILVVPIFGISAWLLKYIAAQLEAIVEMILELD